MSQKWVAKLGREPMRKTQAAAIFVSIVGVIYVKSNLKMTPAHSILFGFTTWPRLYPFVCCGDGGRAESCAQSGLDAANCLASVNPPLVKDARPAAMV